MTNWETKTNIPLGHPNNILKNGISLFFPAYNEEENVGATIEKSQEVLNPLDCDYEIIIVDDGSQDRTAEIVNNYAVKDSRIVLIRHGFNQGYGAALQTGFKSCRYGLIFFSDCDLQFDLKELNSFLEKMSQDIGIEGVIGYRIRPIRCCVN